MDAVNQFLENDGQEKLLEAKRLNDVEAKNDPDNEPYKSKYKAREILLSLKERIEEYKMDDPENEKWTFLLSHVHLKLGCNYMETEELSKGEEYLSKCEGDLEEYKFNKHVCTLYMDTLCQLGILWTGRLENHKALEYLQKAESFYHDFKSQVGNAPYMVSEIFTPENDDVDENIFKLREDEFENGYTHILYYMAQVYGKLEENEKSAKYCHETLQRQLDTMKYTPLEWALNCATLSQYYITIDNYTMARHCMAAASQVIKECGDLEPYQPPGDELSTSEVEEKERLPRAHSDLARCWVKYGLALLETSMNKQMQKQCLEDHNNDDEKNIGEDEAKRKNEEEDEEALAKKAHNESEKSNLFFNIEMTAVEEQITDKYIENFEQAREVFLLIQKWVNFAKNYYGIDGHCSDHVELIQDMSKAFKFLAYFEMDFDRQCKMHKRRVDMLNRLLKELNPQYYLMVCRQIMFETAEAYSHMLDLKLAIMEDEGGIPTPHSVKKINQLAENSISKYLEYIDSLKLPDKKLPELFASDSERPALVAHFCLGRLYSKYIEQDPQKRITWMKLSLQYYKFIVDYIKKNPKSESSIKAEYEICAELVMLLPAKMERERALMMASA